MVWAVFLLTTVGVQACSGPSTPPEDAGIVQSDAAGDDARANDATTRDGAEADATDVDAGQGDIGQGDLGSNLPPDPSTLATPVSETTATSLADGMAFLYSGPNPIQTGVTPGTITATRAAVIRGRVIRPDGSALPGAQVSIQGHPEFGQTRSRADGMYDLVVNGGGSLVVAFELSGSLRAQRRVTVPWQDFAYVPEVALVPLDAAATVIDLSAPSIQVARGSVVSDADGTRQATLLFAPGTHAIMRKEDGTSAPLATLTVRATEYTVGANGPKAMPGDLPAASGYTYAVDYSIDEALAAHTSSVVFDRPVIAYTDNFLHFPVGSIVPSGSYERRRAAWIPEKNGRVIKVITISGGTAAIDLDGSGRPADAAALTAAGITSEELVTLGGLYAPEQTLWRVPIAHFSPWDFNWPYGPPATAVPPRRPPPRPYPPPEENPCNLNGSIVECQNLALGEEVELAGTPYKLTYRSSRTEGRATAYTLEIPLSGPELPPDVRAIEVEVLVAGQTHRQTLPPAPNQSTTFRWDGNDAYGRRLIGRQPITVRIGYTYGGVYLSTQGRPNAVAYDSVFGHYSFFGAPATADEARQEVTLWQEWRDKIGTWDGRAFGLGGWSLSVHHIYDRNSRTLYLGDGRTRRADALPQVITTVAGTGQPGFTGDGGPARSARVSPHDVAVAPDGSLFLAEASSHRIRRIDPAGIIHTFAGNGTTGTDGDGGPATAAQLGAPFGVALGLDGSLYIADSQFHRVRKVTPDGIIHTIAGDGQQASHGDGGPASASGVGSPEGLAVGPDGSLYIAEGYPGGKLRRIGPDGIIESVSDAPQIPQGVAVGPDGSIYFGAITPSTPGVSIEVVRQLHPDGTKTVAAGSDWFQRCNLANCESGTGFAGDGGAASEAKLSAPRDVAVAPDGTLFIADYSNFRIRRVGVDGIITTLFGTGTPGISGELGPAAAASGSTLGMAVGNDGSLYFADLVNGRVRRISSALPGLGDADAVASEDGRELYVFDGAGRHLSTRNAVTGAIRLSFNYDAAGRLISVADANGNTTTIERTTEGRASAIRAPFSQRTTLSVDANGYLQRIEDPTGAALALSVDPNGLLMSMTDRNGGLHSYSYDSEGRLIRDANPAGGGLSLALAAGPGSSTVTITSGLGRARRYRSESLPTGGSRQTVTDPAGGVTIDEQAPDVAHTTTYQDGTSVTTIPAGDPRFGGQASFIKNWTLRTPGGLRLTQTLTRNVTLMDANDPLSLSTQTDSTNINGRVYSSTYDKAARTIRRSTPAGRLTTTTLDAAGRPESLQVTGLDPTVASYDAAGRIATLTSGSGANARTVTFGYDPANGMVSSITDPLGRVTRLAYDAAGRQISETLPDGRVISYLRNASGYPTSVTPPGGAVHGFTYTPGDLVGGYSPPLVGGAADLVGYVYDIDGSATQVSVASAPAVDTAYDAAGRISAITTAAGVIRYNYDPATGDLASLDAPGSVSLAYAYDGLLLRGLTWSGAVAGTVTRTHDNYLRTTALAVNGNSIAFGYDADGLLTSAGAMTLARNAQTGALTGTTLGSSTEAWTYNTLGEPLTFVSRQAGTLNYSETLRRDGIGRIVEKTETIGGVTSVTTYGYDLAGRLETVQVDGANAARYAYDPAGNRSSVTRGLNTSPASYDARDRLVHYAGDYNYGADGSLRSRTSGGSTWTYDYDALGDLRAVVLPGGRTISYLIDGQHRRVGKQVDGALTKGFLYEDRRRIVAELDAAGAVVSRFVYGAHDNVPDSMIRGAVTYRIVKDHLGSPRLVVNIANGMVAQRIDYDEFGRVMADSSPGFQPFGFSGGIYDPDTGLVRFGARDYDAETGRWTARDPLLFGARSSEKNLYVYVENDPVNLRDPDGLFSIGGSAYVLVGAGAKLAIDRSGFSVCVETGLGFGQSAEVDPFGDLDKEGVTTKAEVGFTLGPAELKLQASLDGSGCAHASLPATLGPFGGDGLRPGSGISGESGIDLHVPEFGAGAEAKVVVQKCWQALW